MRIEIPARRAAGGFVLNRAAAALLFGALLGGCASTPAPPPSVAAQANAPAPLIGFSPARGGMSAESVVLQAIAGARKTIRVAAYSFTSKPIAQALVAAQQRGVQVRAVIDKTNRPRESQEYSAATAIAQGGAEVRISTRYAIMHNKFMVIDGARVETGSFNYTASAAQRNAENAVYLDDRAAAQRYLAEWQLLWDEATETVP